jgi:hypothetical protein
MPKKDPKKSRETLPLMASFDGKTYGDVVKMWKKALK